MAIKTREKLLQKCLTDIFALSTPELEDTAEYLTVLRYRTAGRKRTARDFELATHGIERRIAERGITLKDIESEIQKVRRSRERLSRGDARSASHGTALLRCCLLPSAISLNIKNQTGENYG